MNLDKNKFNLLLAKWMKWDGELWADLRDIQIKILFERIVTEMTYVELCKIYKTTPDKIKQVIAIIFLKVEKSHGKELADLFREIDKHLDAIERGAKEKCKHLFEFEKIYLN